MQYGATSAIALLLFGTAVCAPPPHHPDAAMPVAVRDACSGVGAEAYFAGLLSAGSQNNVALAEGLADFLVSMDEEPLSCGQAPDQVYRLSIKRWRGEHDSMRVWRMGDVTFVRHVAQRSEHIVNGRGDLEQRIPQHHWDAVSSAARALDLLHRRPWQLPPPGGFQITPEGQTWMFEVRDGSHYNVAVRGISHVESPGFLVLARALHAAAGVPLPWELTTSYGK